MGTDSRDKRLEALQSFKDWSNYVLIATVAAVGWIASNNVRFSSDILKSACLWSLGVSIVFGILVLALIPLVTQQLRPEDVSIYRVRAEFSLFRIRCRAHLAQACRPQHILFMVGMVLFCLGTTKLPWIGLVIAILAAVGAWLSKPKNDQKN